MKKNVSIKEIIDFLGNDLLEIKGNPEGIVLNSLATVDSEGTEMLDWINRNKEHKQEILEKSSARVIIVDPSLEYTESLRKMCKVLLVVDDPRFAVLKLGNRFFMPVPAGTIHPTAVVDPEAVIGENVTIGANVVIGKSHIGDNTVIDPNVTIYDRVIIGRGCKIYAGVVLGTDGLGCQRDENGILHTFPHLGGIVIGDDVVIGANSQIARGALSNTIIGNGVKMNGLCFISHNCVLKENVWITGNVMLAGSVTVEKNSVIFSHVIVREQRRIGTGATIGMGAVVTKDVPPHETWAGNPAKKMEK